jgi:hypothetical protein
MYVPFCTCIDYLYTDLRMKQYVAPTSLRLKQYSLLNAMRSWSQATSRVGLM